MVQMKSELSKSKNQGFHNSALGEHRDLITAGVKERPFPSTCPPFSPAPQNVQDVWKELIKLRSI